MASDNKTLREKIDESVDLLNQSEVALSKIMATHGKSGLEETQDCAKTIRTLFAMVRESIALAENNLAALEAGGQSSEN